MGIIVAKFSKKKSTVELLDTLDKEIKSIETLRRNTEQAYKKIVGRFLLISVIVYLATAFLFYFYFFPATFYDRLFYIIPLILAPVIIISTKKGLIWYSNRKITKKQLKLEKLNEEKKKILDKVMETETYKVATTILEKYAPEQIKKSNYSPSWGATPVKSNNVNSSVVPSKTGLRYRAIANTNQPSRSSFGGYQTPSRPIATNAPATVAHSTIVSAGTGSISQTMGLPSLPLPLPRAILPRERSVLDKMVEYLVGDGPSNRYALICKQCFSHNGMAVREEFEYLSFYCCYCYTLNPARKKRQFAPKLQMDSRTPLVQSASDTSESDKNSPSDSDNDLDGSKIEQAEITTSDSSKHVQSDNEKNDLNISSSDKVKSSLSELMDVDLEFQKEANEEIVNASPADEIETKTEVPKPIVNDTI